MERLLFWLFPNDFSVYRRGKNTERRLDRELTGADCRHFINGGMLNTSSGPVEQLKFIGRG
jgi:hypothetical protein